MKTSLIIFAALILIISTSVFGETNDLRHFDFNDEEAISSISMSVLVASLGGIEYIEGAEIACITPGGVIAGATALYGDPSSEPLPPSWGFAVWGDEPLTEETVEGFVDGEQLRFLYWDTIHEWDLDITFEIDEGDGIFVENSLLVIDATVSVETGEPLIPLQFGLNGIFPNPFNSKARIDYTIATQENVSILLYNLTGQLVKELSNGIHSPGKYQCFLDGADISTGIYIVKLKSSTQTQTRQIILLK